MSIQFGDRLKELRIEKQLTQEELAKIFNTGKASISNYEQNTRLPDANTISRYADYFGVSVDYILGKSNIRKPEATDIDPVYFRLMQDAKRKGITPKDIEKAIKFIEDARREDEEE